MDKKPIKWSDTSEETFKRVVHYLNKNWSKHEVNNFRLATFKVIRNISESPRMYPKADQDNTREALVMPHISLLYEILPKKIELLIFWDNRQDPRRKPYNG